MAIKYKAQARKKPGTQEVKYYPSAVNQGVVKLQQLAESMALESTVTEHDIKAVLSSLQQWITRFLQEGKSVRLGDLGSFHVTLSTKGEDAADEVTAADIKAVRVHFSKGARLRSNFALTNSNVSFEKVGA